MKTILRRSLIALLLIVSSDAYAQVLTKGVQYTPLVAAPIAPGQPGTWVNSADGMPYYHSISNTNTAFVLVNSGLTINTTGPLAGGGTVALGGSLTLTCTTCVVNTRQVLAGAGLTGGGALSADVTISMPNTGPGSGTIGGGATFINSITLDAQGRATAVATGTPAGSGVPTSRAINTTTPLGGGGTLAADLTLTCTSCLVGTPSAVGDIMYSTSGGQSFTALADAAVNNVLLSGGVGVAPSYGKVANAALANSSLTVTAGTGLSGGGSVALGASTTLSMPAVGPGAGTIGGGATFINSVTLDAQGRVTAAATGTPPAGTITNIATSAPLSGGPITTTGTLSCPTCINGSPSAIGDLLYSTSGGAGVTALADVVAGSYLRSGGTATAPLWSTLTLPNAATTGDILYATGTNAVGRLADVAVNNVLLSGGIGAGPSYGTVPNAALTNSSITVTTASPLGGAATVALGGTLALTCSTCLTTSSLGNWVFSGNNATLTGAGTMGIGLTTATAIALGVATTVTTNAVGTAQTPGLSLSNTAVSTTGAQQYSPTLSLLGTRFTGSVSQVAGFDIQAISPSNGTDAGQLAVYGNIAGAKTQLLTFGLSTRFGAPYYDLVLSNGGNLDVFTSTGDGYQAMSGQLFQYIAGNAIISATASSFKPTSSGALSLGSSSVLWGGVYNNGPDGCKFNSQSTTTYSASATDCHVMMTNAAARTLTLPAASGEYAGQVVYIEDGNNNASSASISAARSGSDTINGGTANVVAVSVNSGKSMCTADGVSAWTCSPLTSGGGGSTGNWTFSGNNADLSGGAAMGIGGTTATSVVLGAAAIPTTVSGALTVSPATNQIVLGTTRTLTLTSPEPATSSRTLTLPDPGGSDSVAYLALAQTLTSKTLTTPVIGTGLTATGAGTVDFSGATSAFKFPTGNVTLPVATGTMTGTYTLGGTPTLSSALTFTNVLTRSTASALATTIPTTPWITLNNTTAAAANAQQISGNLEMCGAGWKTTATAASQVVCNGLYTLPVQSTTAPISQIAWYTAINGGTRGNRLFFSYDGTNPSISSQSAAGGTGIVFNNSSGPELQDNAGDLAIYSSNNFYTNGQNRAGFLGRSGNSWFVTYTAHIESNDLTKPTCVVGTGAGTGATCSLSTNSTDTAGIINVVLGTTPTASATLVTVTPNAAFDTAMICTTTPASAAAALNTAQVFMSTTLAAGSWVMSTGATGVTTGTLSYTYHCVGGTNVF